MNKNNDSKGGTNKDSTPHSKVGPIVSSAHLASGSAMELSELEFGLIVAGNAFNRWMVRCMNAAGLPELSPVGCTGAAQREPPQSRQKNRRYLPGTINVEDSHTVTYALKKLLKLGVVVSEKRGKETYYSATEEGIAVCRRYREIREECLVDSLRSLGFSGADTGAVAGFLRGISGLYDQAARSAASL